MKLAPFFFALGGVSFLLLSACSDRLNQPVGPAFGAAPKPAPEPLPPRMAVIISAESGASPIVAEPPPAVRPPPQVSEAPPVKQAPPPVPAAPVPPPPAAKPPPPPPPPPPPLKAPPPAPPVVDPTPAPVIKPAAQAPAAPPQIAVLPPPAPPKPHVRGPLANPDDLIGLSTEQVLLRLGQPNLKRHETPAELWQYHSPLCLLELRLRPDNNVLKVAETALKPHAGQTPTAAACLGALNTALRLDPSS